jgi:hypothetical protein
MVEQDKRSEKVITLKNAKKVNALQYVPLH